MDAAGALWIGTSVLAAAGLARLQDGQWQVFTEANSDLPADGVRALAVDAAGALWIGTSDFGGGGGLARLQDGQWQVFTEANSDLPADGVFGAGGGCRRRALDRHGRRWRRRRPGAAPSDSDG